MITKGIRGAITVDSNTSEALKDATLELLKELFKQNHILLNSELFTEANKNYEILRPACHSERSEESQNFPPQNDQNTFQYSVDNISHIIFTTTKDLNAEFPAKFARLDFGLKDTAMMCFHEFDVPNSLKMCLRVLIVLNFEPDFVPKFVYLKGASKLR